MCLNGLLFILNGIIKLKYRQSNGLTTQLTSPSSSGISGTIKRKHAIEKTRIVPTTASLEYPIQHFEDADKQPLKILKIWHIARHNSPVARALYHYAQQKTAANLRKVLEEIIADTYSKPKTKGGKVPFPNWNSQKWSEPEVGYHKMDEFWEWLHNSYLQGDKALHSEALSNKLKAELLKASKPVLLSQEASDIIYSLLTKWITSK